MMDERPLASSIVVGNVAYTILEMDKCNASEDDDMKCHFVGRTKNMGKCCVYKTKVLKPLFKCGREGCSNVAHLECYVGNVLSDGRTTTTSLEN